MNELNVFKKYYYPPKRIIKNAKVFFLSFKHAYQRVVRGYADCDVWNFDFWLSNLISESLHQLSNEFMGHPCDMTEDEWYDYLREISIHFKNYSEGMKNWENPVEYPDNLITTNYDNNGNVISRAYFDTDEFKKKKASYAGEEIKHSNYLKAEVAEGFKMISDRFSSMWD